MKPIDDGLDHLAIVVSNTECSLKVWRDEFGFHVTDSEVVNLGAVRLTHLELGNVKLQLVEPLTEGHPLLSWLGERKAALHHFCFKVDEVTDYQELSSRPPHDGVRGKRSLFLDKLETEGIVVEITGQ